MWRRQDFWCPPGVDLKDENPALIFTFHHNKPLVRMEISHEAPEYPVFIKTIGANVYGERARSIQIRHAHLRDDKDNRWWDFVQCRLDHNR